MRIAAISALGLLLAAGSAYAQSSYDYRDRDDSRGNTYGGQSYDQSYDRSSRSDWSRDGDRQGMRKGMRHGARGAAFSFKNGDKEFRVRCGGEESTRECVDAALMMFRQVQDSARTTSGAYSPSTGSTSGSTGSTSSTTGSSVSPGSSSGSTGGSSNSR